ncbi:MAG: DUF1192 domain-containing protein [Hyphomicrobium sp.]|jgi:uncharacterized small protein (DUF1192 family)|uniref:DUF1192 domain-containing protein n=1 Tax=Hyphomicrobium sp. TaxID=82 RepID=UPI0025BA9375|nr:DUF1192 domain-containing protein [Hyphomicrobium sp.]MBX9862552.1 DUF1192 domain-containing protein [Hyphomicrobium sp.]
MDWDDVRPAAAKSIAVGENLETLSVAELEHRIAAFTAEIERVTAELGKKRAHETAAAALFKKLRSPTIGNPPRRQDLGRVARPHILDRRARNLASANNMHQRLSNGLCEDQLFCAMRQSPGTLTSR